MNKHIELLEQLYIWHWDKDGSEFYAWITLSPSSQNWWFKSHIYDYFKL